MYPLMESRPVRVIGEIRGEMSGLTYWSVDHGSMWAEKDVMRTETTDSSDSTDEQGRQQTAEGTQIGGACLPST